MLHTKFRRNRSNGSGKEDGGHLGHVTSIMFNPQSNLSQKNFDFN